MTIRQIFEAVLIECNKIQAPTLKLYEFNYLIKKAINQYVNKIYNIYDLNQQTTDDLRVLKSTISIPATEKNSDLEFYYEVNFPKDYLHLLNLRCIYQINNPKQCQESHVEIPAKKLTSDSYGTIMTDVYNRPSPKNPYYCICNIEIDNSDTESDTESFNLFKNTISEPIKPSSIGCKIRCGNNSKFQLKNVIIDYIREPRNIQLTQEQLDLVDDTSQIMEFPDYVNQEIINELVHLILERSSNPRLNTNMQITQSIARPTEQQQK